ncbi:SCO3242 family prenyltransferase [Plantactinospora soyae]|uniref:4-hydroxybenzoate polyprenyltransferase n=1 Tax=Plantactinospora soyae TaxID=1544732 RepID=A0A927ME60_9ACTN|nr:UbiA family prenyltransferase [Plantactinospora soyae]MBE1492774.1 4-hydroxybenzoate polyprenyltransferase [Plantactinospora soyae]
MPSLRDLAQLVRAPAALSVPGDVVAGAAAAQALDRRVPGLAGASVLLYWGGMAANDWADRELDARERPERPIPSGRVSPGFALGVSAGLTAAGVALAGLAGGRRALAVAVPLAGTIWAYDLVAKNTSAGPAVMAACRGLDVLLGASQGRTVRAVPAALTVAAHTYTVTELSRREVSGASRALPAATLAGTAAVAAAAMAGRRSGAGARGGDSSGGGDDRSHPDGANRWTGSRAGPGWRALVPAVLAGWYGLQYGAAQARVAADPQASRVRAAVGAGITGLPALQGALVARAGAAVLGVAVAAAAPLGRRLARKVSPT